MSIYLRWWWGTRRRRLIEIEQDIHAIVVERILYSNRVRWEIYAHKSSDIVLLIYHVSVDGWSWFLLSLVMLYSYIDNWFVEFTFELSGEQIECLKDWEVSERKAWSNFYLILKNVWCEENTDRSENIFLSVNLFHEIYSIVTLPFKKIVQQSNIQERLTQGISSQKSSCSC